MVKTKLFDGKITAHQAILTGAWYANLLLILYIWAATSADLITSGGVGGAVLAFGRLFGLLAAYFALTQFLLMGRILWIERAFGLDHLASFHRFNGYATITSILIHAQLVVLGYALSSQTGFLSQYAEIIRNYSYVAWALVGAILFLLVVVSSIYIVRRRLKFESWYFVHLLAYAAIVLAFFHQLAVGGSFQSQEWMRTYWYLLYAFVGFSVLFWRFGLSTINLLRFGFKVSRVEKETDTTTSIYITGKRLQRLPLKAGQYVLVRFLGKGFIDQEHPFSVSGLPNNNELRLTVKKIGDYTGLIPNLKVGTRVLLSGPFGRFTSEVAQTDKRLFIAGGVGITPIRTLIEEALEQGKDSVLLYANRSQDDVIFKDELGKLEQKGLKLVPVFSSPSKGYSGETGYVDGSMIVRLVPDFADRDIYICGPQPMMDGVVGDLLELGVNDDRLHFERFALIN